MINDRFVDTARLEQRRKIEPMTNLQGRGRGTAGFTLMELMLVLAIMLLAGIIVATGLPAAMRAYESAVDTANAQVLLSDSVSRLRSELATADPESVNEITTSDFTDGLVAAHGAADGAADGAIITDKAEVLVSFRSLSTGYVTAILNDTGKTATVKGIQIVKMPANWNGQPDYDAAQFAPLIPDAAGIRERIKSASLYTTIDEIGVENPFNGVFTVKGLAVTRNGVVIPNASIEDDLKVRIVVE